MSRHIVLLGDSSFDNASYTRGAPDVANHLRARVPSDTRVTLLALDGATTVDGAAARALVAPGRSLVVCTIYEGNLALPEAPRAKVALRMWNDVITRSARDHGAQLLEMRDVCNLPEHFANPIEPSGAGGRRIAEAIARMC